MVKDVPGLPGYKVSDSGRLWCYLYRRKEGGRFVYHLGSVGREVRPKWVGSGVMVRTPWGYRSLARLILLTFAGPPPGDLPSEHRPRDANLGRRWRAWHVDQDPRNNRLDNLEWRLAHEMLAEAK